MRKSSTLFARWQLIWYLLLALSLSVNLQAQTIRYVNAGASGTGTSWANASGDLQAMIDASAVNDQVWVAAGTYKPTNGTNSFVSFAMKAGVAIYGGFVGNETGLSGRPPINPVAGQPSSTTLSGDIGAVGNPSDNVHHVINNSGNNLTNTAVLDGFVITGGNAGNDQVRPGGGAILNQNSSPSIVNCSLLGNLGNDGGAITNTNGSSPTLINCVLQGNSANQGGAIFNLGNSRPTLTNCSLRGNSANRRGGAIYSQSSSPLLTNCSLQDNVSNDLGGAICNEISSPTLTNCSLRNNTASNFGGAIVNIGNSNPTLVNCSLQNNRVGITGGYGGAIYNQESSPRLVNCSLQGNSATSFGGAIANRLNSSPSLTNSVVWGNGGANTIYNDNATLTANYSLFDASVTGYSGTNNLTTTTSPFASTGSVALKACSSAINAGSNEAYSTAGGPSTDLASNPRIVGTIIDMGAVEFRGTPDQPIAITQQPASSSTVVVGDDVRVSARVSGQVTSFQWYKDGPSGVPASVNGQTTPDLRLDNVTLSQAGSYSLVAISECSSVTTTAFSLSVVTPAAVVGTKTVAGSFTPGGAITYSIVLTNTGQITQGDNTDPELEDPLPTSLSLTSASATSGRISTAGGRTVRWDGSLTSGASVTITIGATINPNTSFGQSITNQATILYDARGEGRNQDRALTDDPTVGGTADPTRFTVVEPSQPGQPIRYVRAGASGDGRSWATASGDLQAMINAAGVEQVWVAAGTYKPTTTGPDSRTISFVMKEGVAIYGGFVGNETALDQRPAINPVAGQPSSTTLSGDIGTVSDNSDNSYHVILNYKNGLTSRAVLDGFVIRGGNANGPDSDPDQDRGGGMYNEEASPSVRNCLFQGNVTQSGYGGGMANLEGSSPRLTNCSFVGNSSLSGGYGGGLANQSGSNPELVNCSFVGNSAGRGGAVISEGGTSSYISCSFVNNSATAGYGGAVDNVFGAQSSFLNCSFVGNSVNGGNNEGGAIYTSSLIRLTNCSFVNNSASRGGALALSASREIHLTNCSFVGNRANGAGGAIYTFSSLRLTNCSFLGNRATTGGAVADDSRFQVQLTNSVLWDNGGANTFSIRQVEDKPSSLAASYSLFDNTVTGYAGTANLTTTTSPFASATDVALTACAPALNAGSNEAYQDAGGPATDLIGNPRIVNSTIDMGAVEFQGQPNQPVGFVQPPTNASACAGSNLSIPLSVSGTGPFSVQLYRDGTPVGTVQSSPVVSFSNIQAGDAGSYQVAVTGACNSVTSTAFNLSVEPQLSISLTSTGPLSCTNTSVTLTALPGGRGTYVFSPGATQVGGSSGNTATVSTAGTYSVTLTSPTGCPASATIAVGSNTAPPAVSISPSATAICGGQSATLTATPGLSNYRWSTGQTTPSIAATATGTYSVTATTSAGCSATASARLTVNARPPAPYATPIPRRLYTTNFPIPLILYALPTSFSTEIRFYNGATNTLIDPPFVRPNQPGVFGYYATQTDSKGCVSLPTPFSLTVLDGGTLVSKPADRTVCQGTSTVLSLTATGSNLSYTWYESNPETPLDVREVGSDTKGGKTASLTINKVERSKLYYCLVVGQFGVGVAGPIKVTANANCRARLAADESGELLSVRVLGNPLSGNQVEVEVRGAEGQPLRLQVTDLTGRSVSQKSVDQAAVVERQTLDVGQQAAGVLLLRVSTPSQAQTLKVLKVQ